MFLKIKNYIIKDRKIILTSLVVGLIVTFTMGMFTKVYSDTIQSGIANEVIRFHVLANSNSKEDQDLKLKVRDGILNEFKDQLNSSKNINETRQIILSNIDNIEKCSEKIIKEQGYNYQVSASLSFDEFPTKDYGDISFPAGEYETLRIVIGSGEGNNWWCVMFPPLCFVDVTHSKIPNEDKKELKTILTDEEYNIVVRAKSEDVLPFKVKFKVVEWWQKKSNSNGLYESIK